MIWCDSMRYVLTIQTDWDYLQLSNSDTSSQSPIRYLSAKKVGDLGWLLMIFEELLKKHLWLWLDSGGDGRPRLDSGGRWAAGTGQRGRWAAGARQRGRWAAGTGQRGRWAAVTGQQGRWAAGTGQRRRGGRQGLDSGGGGRQGLDSGGGGRQGLDSGGGGRQGLDSGGGGRQGLDSGGGGRQGLDSGGGGRQGLDSGGGGRQGLDSGGGGRQGLDSGGGGRQGLDSGGGGRLWLDSGAVGGRLGASGGRRQRPVSLRPAAWLEGNHRSPPTRDVREPTTTRPRLSPTVPEDCPPYTLRRTYRWVPRPPRVPVGTNLLRVSGAVEHGAAWRGITRRGTPCHLGCWHLLNWVHRT